MNIHRFRYLMVLSTLCCVVFVSPRVHAEWTQFRGSGGQGHVNATDVPVHWNESDHVVWKTEIPGTGWSSPVVSNNRIYLTSAIPAEDDSSYSLSLLILDGNSGKILHRADAFQQARESDDAIHSKNSHASPTPIIDGERIYTHFGHQGIACFDLDGKLLWRNDSYRYPPRHGQGGSPALVDGKLIFSCDGDSDPFILAVSAQTGEIVWRTPRETDAAKTFSFCTPLAIEVAGRTQVIIPGSNCVLALDPATGDVIWRVNYEGYSVVPRPVFGHGLVYISTSFDSPVAMAIRPDGEGNVTETHVAWEVRRSAPNTPSLLLVDDCIYMVSDRGVASCLDATSGDIHWQERLGGNFSASPVFANGHVYFLDEKGLTTVVQASKEFKQVAQNDLGERSLASFGVIDNDFLIRTEQRLFRVGKGS